MIVGWLLISAIPLLYLLFAQCLVIFCIPPKDPRWGIDIYQTLPSLSHRCAQKEGSGNQATTQLNTLVFERPLRLILAVNMAEGPLFLCKRRSRRTIRVPRVTLSTCSTIGVIAGTGAGKTATNRCCHCTRFRNFTQYEYILRKTENNPVRTEFYFGYPHVVWAT